MKIDLTKIRSNADQKLDYEAASDLTEVKIGGVTHPISVIQPFGISLSNEANKRMLVSGETKVHMVLPCDRCLSDVQMEITVRIEREFHLTDGVVIFDEEEENTCIEGDSLDVDRLIYDEILVDWPTKVLCQDDCKGICSVCGQDLNLSDCGCDRQGIDPRMAKFQDIFNEFKEV